MDNNCKITIIDNNKDIQMRITVVQDILLIYNETKLVEK